MKLTMTTRSKLQFQALVSYSLDRDKKTVEHVLEAYLLAPKSLAIDDHTYPNCLFYRALQTWSQLLPRLRPLSHRVSSESGLLPRLEECVSRFLPGGDEHAMHEFETHHRAFCRILKDSVDAHLEYIRRKKSAPSAVSMRSSIST